MAGGKKITRLIVRLPGCVIGALFIYAGVLKALDPAQFALDIANFRLLPHAAGVALALYLPWLEIVCGAALLLRKMYRGALLIVAALCLVFLAALVSARARGLDIACGCFGHEHPHPLANSIMLDAMLFVALAFLLALEFKRCKT